MIKLKAIGASFLVTVVPTLVIFVCCMAGGYIVNKVYDELFSIMAFIGLILLIPIGIVGFYAFFGGISSMSSVYACLQIFKIGNKMYTINTNPSATSTAAFGFVISLILFLLMVPISVFVWLAFSIVILCSHKKAEYVISVLEDPFEKPKKLIAVCLGSLCVACVNFGLLALQDSIYAVNNFDFSYIELSCTGKEWEGRSNEAYSYDLKYNFQNVSKKEGGLRGAIVVELRNSDVRLELKDKNLTVYAPPLYQRDFNKHEVYYYFYVPVGETRINNMLQTNLNNARIYLEITEADWGNTKVRHYKKPKVIMLKDFGVPSNNTPSPNPGTSDSQDGNTNETEYQNAITKYNQGDYEGAKAIFSSLGTYKQSLDYVELCEDKIFYKTMEQSLITVAGNNAILPDKYVLYLSYSPNEYIYYNGSYRLGFYADFYSDSAEIEEYINSFILKLINNGYSEIDNGTYKKENTIIQLGYFVGDSYFTYYAFKI